jgi:acyl-CoA thioester hydrolase
MKVVTPITVRSYECDSYGHVNNAIYLNYLEHARMEFLHAAGFDYKGIVAAGFYLYVTHIDIRYKASARLDDELVVETEPVKLQRVSGAFRQIIRRANGPGDTPGEVCAEATVTWASVTTDSKLAPLPARFMVPGLKPAE